MTKDIVYGTKSDKEGYGQFIELFMFDEDNHLGINCTNDGHANVFHFLIKDKSDYEDFKNELVTVLKNCEDIDKAYYALESYLDSACVDDFLEEYPEYKPEIRTEEEISEYMSEAFDRVWLTRAQNNESIAYTFNFDIQEGRRKAIERICKKYNIDFYNDFMSNYDYGYWNGILAALRWVMGDEKDMLDT